jgi:hypothetical protein
MNKKIHDVQMVKTDDDTYLYLNVDGQSYRIRWTECSAKLVEATSYERERVDISPSGYGLHWPLIDEDLAITPLIERAEKVAVELVN